MDGYSNPKKNDLNKKLRISKKEPIIYKQSDNLTQEKKI